MTNFNTTSVAIVAAKAAFVTAAAFVSPWLAIPAVVLSEFLSRTRGEKDVQAVDNRPAEIVEVVQEPQAAPLAEVTQEAHKRPRRKKAQKASDATQKTEQQKPRARRRQN